jgi:hypothetical protein
MFGSAVRIFGFLWSRQPRRAGVKRGTFRPRIEDLEGRLVPATITVKSLADTINPADNVLTLREAVGLVDNPTSFSTLSAKEQTFVKGTLGTNDQINFSLPRGPQTITLTGGPLVLTSSVIITGPTASSADADGGENLTINGNNLDRVVYVGYGFNDPRNAGIAVTLKGLIIANGSGDYGAGVLNFGNLTVNNGAFTGNVSGTSGGGALYNVGTATVVNSLFQNNTSGNKGAAIVSLSGGTLNVTTCYFISNQGVDGSISNEGMATIYNSDFSNNVMSADAGGISNAPSGNLTVTKCGFDHNTVGSDGGAIFNEGTANVLQSDFLYNSSASSGGAIDNHGIMTVENSNIKYNTAGTDGGGIRIKDIGYPNSLTLIGNDIVGNRALGSGGGLEVDTLAPVYLENNLVAGNFSGAAPGTTPSDINGVVDPTSTDNTIGTGGSGGLVDGVNDNTVGVVLP